MVREPRMTVGTAVRKARAILAKSETYASDDRFSRNLAVADKALRLMFPGITDDEIEFPQWFFPNIPTAGELVRHALAALQRVKTKPSRKAARRRTVYWGQGREADEVEFILAREAKTLAGTHRAFQTANSWREFRGMVPRHVYREARGIVEAEGLERTTLDEPLPIELLAEQNFPPYAAKTMLAWMPADIIEQFGTKLWGAIAGDLLAFHVSCLPAIVKALRAGGYDCRKNPTAVNAACGRL